MIGKHDLKKHLAWYKTEQFPMTNEEHVDWYARQEDPYGHCLEVDMMKEMFQEIAAHWNPKNRIRVVDYGCGEAHYYPALRRIFGVGHYVGVDVSPHALKRLVEQRGVGEEETIVGPLEEHLDVVKRSNLVMLINVLIYTGGKMNGCDILRAIIPLAKKGTVVVIATGVRPVHRQYYKRNHPDKFKLLVEKRIVNKMEGIGNKDAHHHFWFAAYRKL